MEKNKKQKSNNSWRFKGNEVKYIGEVLNAGFGSGTTGSMNMRLEEAFAKRFGVKYAVTSNSGTSALHQALLALGVGPGDEVIIPALTVIMCANAVIFTGAKPVFADINPDTFLIDPKDIERKINKKTKVIMPVNLYGQVCDMEQISKIAKKYGLYILEDCAQCFLGKDGQGRLGGTIGDVGSFSFQTSKHITTGDGGILISNSEKIAERIRKFGGLGFKHHRADRRQIKKNRDLFQDPSYFRHDTIGYNYRLSELSAAVGLAQVEKLDKFVSKRQKMAEKYLRAIKETNCDWLVPQELIKGHSNSYWTFAVKYEGEKKLDVSWYDFRKKYIEFGGDGIYAAWALVYNEPAIQALNKDGRLTPEIYGQARTLKGCFKNVKCPDAEITQSKIMQFTTNQNTETEMNFQMNIMKKTIGFFQEKNHAK